MNQGLRIPSVQYCLNHLHKLNANNLKLLCTRPKEYDNEAESSKVMTREEQYRQLENLDFTTAAKILFSDPPKQKKFGLDFHLVQLFFACLPSLAVYLVAQYARSEMKKMDADLHQKKKKDEDEEKAQEAEKISIKDKADSELVDVKVRLGVLEQSVKEIAHETKKIALSISSRGTGHGTEKPAGSVDSLEKATSPQDGGHDPAAASSQDVGHEMEKTAQSISSRDSNRDLGKPAASDAGFKKATFTQKVGQDPIITSEQSQPHTGGSDSRDIKGHLAMEKGTLDSFDVANHQQGLRGFVARWAGVFRGR